VKITFDDKKLEKLANDFKKCQKQMGQIRAKLYNKRLGDLRNALSLEDVRYLPGHYHELTGNRKGKWACDLDQLDIPEHTDPPDMGLKIDVKVHSDADFACHSGGC
jgi:plasmid maintenance system killer protein